MPHIHIKAADWVVAWDQRASRHVYLRGADVVFDEDDGTILYVGHGFFGP